MTAMDYRALLTDVQRRPNAYGLDGSYGQAVAFVTGCDAGNAWGLLVGFSQWLAMRSGEGANLAWPVLVLKIAFPSSHTGPFEPSQNAHAVHTLFGLLDEFLDARQGSGGAVNVLTQYIKWEQTRRNDVRHP